MADKGSKSKAAKRHKKSVSLPSTEAQPGTPRQLSMRDKERPETSKTSKASERDERHRDRVLQKICSQSSSKSSSNPSIHRAGGDNARRHPKDHSQGPAGDSLSLDNPDLAINNPDIWGTARTIL